MCPIFQKNNYEQGNAIGGFQVQGHMYDLYSNTYNITLDVSSKYGIFKQI